MRRKMLIVNSDIEKIDITSDKFGVSLTVDDGIISTSHDLTEEVIFDLYCILEDYLEDKRELER